MTVEADEGAGDSGAPSLPSSTRAPLPPETNRYLEAIASDAFKRGVDLDESVWRSLPFFSATLALTAAVIGHSSTSVPRLSYALFPAIADAILVGAALSLAWSLRWFWQVIRPREYEYPAPPNDIRFYANELATYHRQLGASEDLVGDRIVQELRTFLIAQYADAAETNFTHNEARMKARSFALLFVMVALVLAFACETLIFTHVAIDGADPMLEKIHDGTIDPAYTDRKAVRSTAASSPKGNASKTGCGPVHVPCGGGYQAQTVTDKRELPKPAPTPTLSPEPPPSPARQILKKNDQGQRED